MLRQIIALILLLTSVAKAQEATCNKGTVKGTVYTLTDTTEKALLDGWTKEKILTANVLLLDPVDSSAVTGDATDLKGEYIISGVTPGNYILSVSFIGYKTNKMQISIPAEDTLIKNVQLDIAQDVFEPSVAVNNFLRINAQGVIVYQPEDDYLLEVTQKWASERSKLGDLRVKPIDSTDIVLRFWDGYGMFGTRGILLKRVDGRWSGRKLNVKSCPIFYPDSLKGKITKKDFFLRDFSTKDCNGDKYEYGSLTTIDTVLISPLNRPRSELKQSWNELLETGLLDLPTHVEHNWVMTDGRGFVIEVRVGDLYRASVLTYLKEPQVKAHKRIKKLAKILYRNLDPYD